MQNPFVHRVGGVVSADIAVPDHERELGFYSSVLTTGESPLWKDDLTNNLGMPVIGLGQRIPEYEALPLQWMPHFQVADVAASVALAMEHGGKTLMQDEQNQWAVLEDQYGAAFGIIPVVLDPSPQQDEEFGRITWLSLHVADVASSSAFYKSVIGWNPIRKASGSNSIGTAIELWMDQDTTAGEIGQASEEQNEIPSVWLIHLNVADLNASLHRVRDAGGAIMEQCEATGSAVIRDPVGVFFALRGTN